MIHPDWHLPKLAIRRDGLMVVGLSLLLIACGGPNQTAEETTSPTPPIATAPSPTETQGSSVDVKLSEFTIEMPTTLPAGPTTFNVTNIGKLPHNIEIEGNDIEVELESDLGSGESGVLQVDLTPGTYKVYCPVGNHEGRGMVLELTVS